MKHPAGASWAMDPNQQHALLELHEPLGLVSPSPPMTTSAHVSCFTRPSGLPALLGCGASHDAPADVVGLDPRAVVRETLPLPAANPKRRRCRTFKAGGLHRHRPRDLTRDNRHRAGGQFPAAVGNPGDVDRGEVVNLLLQTTEAAALAQLHCLAAQPWRRRGNSPGSSHAGT